MCQPPFRCRRIDERRLRRIANAIVLIGDNFLIRRKYRCAGAGIVPRGCGCDVRMGARQCWSRTVRMFWDERRGTINVLEFPRSLVSGCGTQGAERERRSHCGQLVDVSIVFGGSALQTSATMVRRKT